LRWPPLGTAPGWQLATLPGVTYQLETLPDLSGTLPWQDHGAAFMATNQLMIQSWPLSNSPQGYYRLKQAAK